MADILHDTFIRVPAGRVYEVVSTGEGLDRWWTKRATGHGELGEEFILWFGPEYDWRAEVTEAQPGRLFELVMTRSDRDWLGTRIRFDLVPQAEGTTVRFAHTGWREPGEHFRISNYCWAMYLRLLKRFLEQGETVDYEARDEA